MVDSVTLKANMSLVYQTCWVDALNALKVVPLGFILYPLRLLVACFFFVYVRNRLRDTDMVRKIVVRILMLLVMQLPIYIGLALSMMTGYQMWEGSRTLRSAFNSTKGHITIVELLAPCRSVVLIIAVEIIRKQRRSMSISVNIVRNRLVCEMLLATGSKNQSDGDPNIWIGPVGRVRLSNDNAFWLLDGCSHRCDQDRFPLAEHKKKLEEQLAELSFHTGSVSVVDLVGGKEVVKGGMQDYLDDRKDCVERIVDSLDVERDRLKDSCHDASNVVQINAEFSDVLQILSAGYPAHFRNEEELLAQSHSQDHNWILTVVSLIYALLPNLIFIRDAVSPGALLQSGRFNLFSSTPDIPIFVFCVFTAQFITFRTMLGELNRVGISLRTNVEALVILQRLLSSSHRRRVEMWRHHEQLAGHSHVHESDVHDCVDQMPVRTGTSHYMDINHKHLFDLIMENYYGARHFHDSAHMFDAYHFNSFLELDPTNADNLRLWWGLRQHVEAGSLPDKTSTEIIMLFFITFLGMELMGALWWYWTLHNQITNEHFIVAWEVLSVCLYMAKVLNQCVHMNSIMRNDARRLDSIRHDLLDKIAIFESDPEFQSIAPSEHAEKRRSSMIFQRSKTKSLHDCMRDPQHPQRFRATNDSNKAVVKLMKRYVERMDRDYSPLRLWGFVIDRTLRTRIALMAFSLASTTVVRITSSLMHMSMFNGNAGNVTITE